MTRLAPCRYASPGRSASRFGAWGGAILVHAVALLALLLNWPQTREVVAQVNPIEVRLLELAPLPDPVRPLPVRPARVIPAQAERPPERAAPVPPVPAAVPVSAPVFASVSALPVAEAVSATTGPSLAVMVAPPAVTAAVPPLVGAPHSASPVPEPLVEARFDANYLSNPAPVYPLASRRQGEAGVVRLHVLVGSDGQALQVELKHSSGFPRLDQSALDTVPRWRFVPARRGSATVASWVVVPIVFSLS